MTKVTDHTSTDTDYEYDPAGRLKQLTYDPGGADRVTAYGYEENGNVTLATYSNGYTSAYAYDDINRATQHVLKDSAGPPNTLEQYDYDYSPGGLPSTPRPLLATISSPVLRPVLRFLRRSKFQAAAAVLFP